MDIWAQRAQRGQLAPNVPHCLSLIGPKDPIGPMGSIGFYLILYGFHMICIVLYDFVWLWYDYYYYYYN